MNINMLRDSDDDAGFYAAGCRADSTARWRGAQIYVSSDAGANYSSLAAIANEATIGVATNVLGDFAGGNIPDESNVLNVDLYAGSLSSTDNTGLLAGTMTLVYGEEIIYARDAVIQGDGTYNVSGLLRGRRGTEYAMGTVSYTHLRAHET